MIIVIDDLRRFVHLPEAEYYTDAHSGLGRLTSIWTQQRRVGGAEQIEELWLDHDLGPTDIMLIVNWLIVVKALGYPLEVKYIWCHSMNPVGADNVVKRLYGIGYMCGHQAMPPCEEQEVPSLFS